MTKFFHPFHLVSPSPWPLLTSLRIINNIIAIVGWFHKINYYISITIPCTLLCIGLWWKDIIRESTFLGFHTKPVYINIRLGIILFIISEVFFFVSFFWAFFHSSLAPAMEIGQLWPPPGICPFNPFNIPLLNTIVLVTSGLTITWSHHGILRDDFLEGANALSITILLGCYFSWLQIEEYKISIFTIADSIYGSTFFLATGFHGFHVIIGTLFLFASHLRLHSDHYSSHHHFGFEGAAWYWHFVDVVWLFLFFSIYWWGR